MYSTDVQVLLKSKRINVGDRVRISKKSEVFEGILMPRIALGDKNTIVLKLDNGYNIGVKYERELTLKLLERGKAIKFKPSSAKARKEPSKPEVSILGCGGTIASRIEYSTGAAFPAFSPSDLLLSFPQLNEIANIDGRKLFDLLSEDMTPSHWQLIAKEVAKEINSKKADGIVLMHGTDTMHFTSSALSYMLQDLPVPVVLVGAQRSSDRGSSDNVMNLICSVLTATSDIAEVSVCMHGSLSDDFSLVHQGTKVRKMHSSRRDTFRSINVLPFARVWYLERKIELLRDDFRKRSKGRVKIDDKLNQNVGLIYSHPAIKPEFIENLSKFYEGIVIAGTGLGHVPTNPFDDKFTKSVIPSLKSLIDSGIPVVIAPQTIYGRIDMNVYTAGRILNDIGVIGNYADWTPEAAFTKLMFVLGHTKDMKKIKEMMMKNVAGEISSRTETETFLV